MTDEIDTVHTDDLFEKPDGTPDGFVPEKLTDAELLAKHGRYAPYEDLTDDD